MIERWSNGSESYPFVVWLEDRWNGEDEYWRRSQMSMAATFMCLCFLFFECVFASAFALKGLDAQSDHCDADGIHLNK